VVIDISTSFFSGFSTYHSCSSNSTALIHSSASPLFVPLSAEMILRWWQRLGVVLGLALLWLVCGVNAQAVFQNEATFSLAVSVLAADGVTLVPVRTVSFRPAAFGGAVRPAPSLTTRLLLAEADDRACSTPPSSANTQGVGWSGSAVLAVRGSCSYALKSFNYQSVNASLVIVHNSCNSVPCDQRLLTPLGGLPASSPAAVLYTPTLFIRHSDGLVLRALLANITQPVYVTVTGSGPLSAIDRPALQTLAQSYGPAMSNAASASTLINFFGGTRSWGDFSNAALDPCLDRLAGIWCENGRVVHIYWDSLALTGLSLSAAFGSLSALRHLVLFNSGLSGAIPCALTSLSALQYLDVSSNSLSSIAPCTTITNLVRLQYFSASSNAIQTLSPDFLLLPQLQYLLFDRNQITSFPAPNATLLSNSSLLHLNLQTNALSGAMPPLAGLRQLQSLLLGTNSLSGSVLSAFDGLPALTSLDASRNRFSGALPQFIGTTALTSIDLSYNAFSGAPPSSWSTLTKLATLYLSHNSIQSPLSALTSPEIAVVDVSYNNLTASSGSPIQDAQAGIAAVFLWSLSSSIRSLSLAHNQIAGSWAAGFTSAWPALTKLDLSYNSITSLPSDLFSSALFTSNVIQVFDVSYNALSGSLPATAPPGSALQVLQLSGNPNLIGPALPAWVTPSSSLLVKATGSNFYCPSLVVPSNPNLVLSIDGSYYRCAASLRPSQRSVSFT
jgi:Leucine-rich repeat (LRR) protein